MWKCLQGRLCSRSAYKKQATSRPLSISCIGGSTWVNQSSARAILWTSYHLLVSGPPDAHLLGQWMLILVANMSSKLCWPRLLLSTILRAQPHCLVVTFGVVCSSFVAISQGSTRRSYWLPKGDESGPSVQYGNLLACRTWA